MNIRKRALAFVLLIVFLAGCARQTPSATPAPLASLPGLLGDEARIVEAEQFLNTLVEGDFAAGYSAFNEDMKAALPLVKLATTWQTLTSQVGALKNIVGRRVEQAPPYERVVLTSEFEKAMLDVRIVYDEAGEVAGLFFAPSQDIAQFEEKGPPGYARMDSFREEEITVGSGEWSLPGTLTVPVGEGPFPAVVLVHGSGPNDQDETIGPNKPFRDLAWGLASRGIAILRYEKRTRAHAEKLINQQEGLTVQEETIDDALLAVDLLRRTPTIDSGQIFLLGHSLGGMLAPRIGLQDAGIAGFIIMAGAARPMEELVLDQIVYISSLDGTPTPEEQEQLDKIRQQVALVKDPSLSKGTDPAELLLGVPAAYWLDLRGYDPPELARRLDRPFLILQGERDYQVTQADFELWQRALESDPLVEFKLYPALNHLFINGEGEIQPEEYMVHGYVAEEVIVDIADWIRKTIQE